MLDRFRNQRHVRRAERLYRGFLAAGAYVTGLRKLHQFQNRDYRAGDIPQKLRGLGKRKRDGEDEASLENSPSAENMATTSTSADKGSGNPKGLDETPIDKVNPYEVYRGPPQYTFASLPYVTRREFTGTINQADYIFRMTSPYDTNVLSNTQDLNAGGGTRNVFTKTPGASDGSAQQARWYNYYATMYKYYHVVSARWTFSLENNGSDDIYVHMMYCNDEIPNSSATNDDMMLWPDVQSQLAKAHSTHVLSSGAVEKLEVPAGSNDEDDVFTTTANFETGNALPNQWGSTVAKFSGEYRPGDYNREIRLDSDVENWTAIDANPKLPECVLFRVKTWNDGMPPTAGNTNDYNRPFSYRWKFTVDYLVEFKELRRGLRYPINRQPATVTINSAPEQSSDGTVIQMETDL